MQKAIIISVFISIFCAGCKKSSSESFQSYFRFSKTGVAFECNTHIRATYLPATIGPDNVITISGEWSGGSIEFNLNESQALAPGTYELRADKWRTMEIRTTPGNAAGTFYAGWSGSVSPALNGSGQITFTEVSPEFVKGNFEFVGINSFAPSVTITNGAFHIKRG